MPCGVGGVPGGRGGRPRALVAGEGWGGRRVVGEEEQVQAGKMFFLKELAWWTGGQGGGARARGGVQGLQFRGGRWSYFCRF